MTAEEYATILFDLFEDIAYDNLSETGNGVEVRKMAKDMANEVCYIVMSELYYFADDYDQTQNVEGYIYFWDSVKKEIEKI